MRPKEIQIQKGLRMTMLLLLSVCILFLLKGWANGNLRSMDSLRQYIGSYGLLGSVILTMIQALQVVLPVLPDFPGCIVGAAMLGAAGGFRINYIGISAGSLAAFWLARQYGKPLVQRLMPMEKYDAFIAWMQKRRSDQLILYLAILLPLAPDDFLCF